MLFYNLKLRLLAGFITKYLHENYKSVGERVPRTAARQSAAFSGFFHSAQKTTLKTKAGYALSNSSRFDVIIMWLISHKEYDVNFVNLVLDRYG